MICRHSKWLKIRIKAEAKLIIAPMGEPESEGVWNNIRKQGED